MTVRLDPSDWRALKRRTWSPSDIQHALTMASVVRSFFHPQNAVLNVAAARATSTGKALLDLLCYTPSKVRISSRHQ